MAASSAEFETAVSAPALGVVRRPRRVDRRRRRETATAYLLILPALILLLLFIIGPLFGGIALSLFNYDLLTPAKFIGLGNYRFLIHDSEALNALRVTLTFTIASVALHVIVGLALALAANRRMPRVLSYGVRTAVFFPVLISWAVVSLIAEFTLDPNFGFITYYSTRSAFRASTSSLTAHRARRDRRGRPLALGRLHVHRSSRRAASDPSASLRGRPYRRGQPIADAAQHHLAPAVTVPVLRDRDLVYRRLPALRASQHHHQRRPGEYDGVDRSIHLREGFVQFHIGYAATLGVLVMVTLLLATLIQFGFARRWVHNDLGD